MDAIASNPPPQHRSRQARQPTSASPEQLALQLTLAAAQGDEGTVRQWLADLLQRRTRGLDDDSSAVLQALEAMFLTLRSMALMDDLTGLCNRRGFLLSGSRLLEEMRRERQTALLCYVDVDRLKYINDSLGHAAGDSALRRTAQVLQEVFHQCAVIGRLGGDEFAVLTPMITAVDCKLIVNRLQRAVEACNRSVPDPPLSLSIGFAQVDSQTAASIAELVQRADMAMYVHKAATEQPSSGLVRVAGNRA